MALCALPTMAQLNGSGYYRFRNAQYTNEYIYIANDLLNYHTVVNAAGGATAIVFDFSGTGARAKALEYARLYLKTDIKMMTSDYIDPTSIIYAKKKSTNASNYDFNLIGQGTSLLTLTTGMYDGSSADAYFVNIYATINSVSNSGTPPRYTAKIDLVGHLNSPTGTSLSLGSRYFMDDNSIFDIESSSSSMRDQWYLEPVEYFNVKPEVEFNGKYYTTIKVPFAFMLSNNVEKAYAITANNNSVLDYTEVATTGGTVPAGTPVVLECTSPNAADCQLIPTGDPLCTAENQNASTAGAPRANQSSAYTGTNLLAGTYFANNDGNQTLYSTTFNANNYTENTENAKKYVLGITDSGKLGFIRATVSMMPANKAWLTSAGVFPTVAAPTISPDGGTYSEAQSVTITAKEGATILYSTDGGATWNEYNEAIPVGEGTTTIQAKATIQGLYNDSEVVSATYTVEIPTPELAITPESMTISDAAAGVFTITGTNVNGNINANLANTSDWYLNPETLSNTGGEVNVTYTGRALTAENTVNAYVANNPDVKASASVKYQTDIFIVTDNGVEGGWNFGNGAQMANEDGIYTATFTATVPNTFILFARKLGDGVNWGTRYVFGPSSDGDWWMPTNVAEQGGYVDMDDDDPIKLQLAGEYTITINANNYTFNIARKFETLAAPEFTPEAGTYEAPQSVTITAQQGATIYYTTDGTDPTTESAVYNEPIAVNDGTMTIKAIAVMEGWNNSEVAEATYIINLPVLDAPVIVPEEGQKNNAVEVTITAAEDAEIYYRINEADEWTKYTEAFTVDGNNQKVEAYAKKANFKDSPVTTATYTFAVAELTFTPAAGSYDAVQTVEIATSTTGAAIQYSINDGEWVDYTGAITVGEGTTTIKAKATKDGYTAAENTAVYVVVIPVTIVLGDVNDDGIVNIADVTKLIDYLLDNSATPFNRNNADVKQDGNIDIADVTSLIDLLLNQ